MQLVVIFSDPNFLALGLLENLLTKNCFVNIVTKDTKDWQLKTSNVANKNRFSIINESDFFDTDFSYSIIISGFIIGEPYTEVNQIFKKFNLESSKNLVVLPFEKYSFDKSPTHNLPENIGIIYCGDLVGPRIDLNSDLLFPQLVSEAFYKRKITLGVGEVLYPVFVADVVKILSKWLFSFGPYGKEFLLTGSHVSGSDFWKINENILGSTKLIYNEKIITRRMPKGLETKMFSCDLRLVLMETYKWINANPALNHAKYFRQKIKSVKKPRRYPKYLKPLIFSLVTIFVLPLILVLITSGLFYFSYKDFLAGKDKSSENLLLLSKTFSVISKEESKALSLIPLVGRVYKEFSFVSSVFEETANIGTTAIPVARSASDLTDKIFGNTVYDPEEYSMNLKTGLDSIYRQISLLQVDTNSGLSSNLVAAKFLQSKIDLEKLINITQYGTNIAQDLPDILGKGKTKTYLILFQNNMELRPTGGFIGSFGILTFDGGRISDLTVNDVYSADGQLNGHVEPPAPIKQYLGEANWWLRDSNWDPDFPTSAKRAEWFLDKEMGRSVDGVMSIDLDPVRNILKYTGPVFLPDYNLEINSGNLYEKTQEEVQSNFFPGSRKKASFLTALSRSLLTEVTKLNSEQKMGVVKSFYSDLDERHIQVFMHNEELQNAISSLSWDGSVSVPSCGKDCYADFVGDVEANLGVNKANYFLTRKQELSVNVGAGGIERTLDITLTNNSNPALGLAGKYKTYMRIVVPDDSEVESVVTISGESAETLNPDVTEVKGRKEIGFLVEVFGIQAKKVEVKWKTGYNNAVYGKYGLYVRKQAGVGNDPFSLTINGKKVYNMTLVDDYFGRFTLSN